MGCLITILYTLCTIQVAVSWIELRNAFVYGTSVQSRYDLIGAPLPLEITSAVAAALNIIVADCTIVCLIFLFPDYCSFPSPRYGAVGLYGAKAGKQWFCPSYSS